jgi:hypothetical protein
LNLPARHYAVLNSKQRRQQHIDDECFDDRRGRSGVDGLGHDEAGNETDRVKEGNEEHDIGSDAVQKCDEPGHGEIGPPPALSYQPAAPGLFDRALR